MPKKSNKPKTVTARELALRANRQLYWCNLLQMKVIVSLFIDTIIEGVAADDKVAIEDFGVFYTMPITHSFYKGPLGWRGDKQSTYFALRKMPHNTRRTRYFVKFRAAQNLIERISQPLPTVARAGARETWEDL